MSGIAAAPNIPETRNKPEGSIVRQPSTLEKIPHWVIILDKME
jgi:hypothetical protein